MSSRGCTSWRAQAVGAQLPRRAVLQTAFALPQQRLSNLWVLVRLRLRRLDESLPGVTRGDMASSRRVALEIRTKALGLSPSGRAFAVASTEGLLVYSLDESLVFDPFELGAWMGRAACSTAAA